MQYMFSKSNKYVNIKTVTKYTLQATLYSAYVFSAYHRFNFQLAPNKLSPDNKKLPLVNLVVRLTQK